MLMRSNQLPFVENLDESLHREVCIRKAFEEMRDKYAERASPISSVLCSQKKHEAVYCCFGGLVLTLWVFGAHPEYFVILYMVIVGISIPLKIYKDVQKGCAAVAVDLELCWVANVVGFAFLLVAALSSQIRDGPFVHVVFTALFGLANGPLLFANAFVLQTPLTFHDQEKFFLSFIHLAPAALSYCFHWENDAVTKFWNGRFMYNNMHNMTSWQDVFLFSFIFYLTWWVLFLSWLVLLGGRYRHTMYKEKDVYQILGVQLLHMLGTFMTISISSACFQWQLIHSTCLVAMVSTGVFFGARQYIYILTIEPLKALNKAIEESDTHSAQPTPPTPPSWSRTPGAFWSEASESLP